MENARPKIELLKCTRRSKEGKRFDNLYLRIDGGEPVEITLAHFNPKLKNFLLVKATNCEIRTSILVREIDVKPTED